jgi:RHS repeat-associated protein
VVTKNLDESTASVTGTAQVNTYSAYSVASSGFLSVQSNMATASSGNWSSVQYDWLGRKVATTVPDPKDSIIVQNPGGGTVITSYSYNSLGQLAKVSTPGMAPTLYSYTPMGALEMTALDVNNNGTIDLAGSDRVSQSDTTYTLTGGNWWLQTQQKVYPTSGSGIATTTKTTSVQLSGLSSGTSVTQTTDIDGNVTTQTTTVNRTTQVVETITQPSGLTNSSKQYVYNGLLVQQTSVNGNTTTYGYDGVGRQVQVTDPRKGPVDTIYYPNSNQVYYTQYDGGSILIAKYVYGPDGRVSSQSDYGNYKKAYTYYPTGQVWTVTGNGAINATYVYDSFGRLSSQTTWTGSSNLPGVVTYAYDGDLPLLYTKTDALNAGVTHTYDSLGREQTRTDSRGTVKTNTYDPNTGELLKCVYTQEATSTPSVTYTYTRAGTLNTVADGAGTRTLGYGADLQVSSETLPACFGSSGGSSSRVISYVYDPPAGQAVGLLTGINLSNTSGGLTNPDQTTAYGYDSAGGRLTSVTANGAGFSSFAFGYSYYPNSELLIGSVTNAATGYSLSYTYDSYRDLVDDSTTAYGGSTEAKFDYTYNDLDQRQTAAQSGSAFSDYGGTTNYTYGYDPKGEVTSAKESLGNAAMPGRQYCYTYDGTGNRLSGDHTGIQSFAEAYSPNIANQIGSKENTSVAVQGNALAAANVVVQTTLANRAGNYWAYEAMLNNVGGPAYGSIPVYAGQAGAGSGGTDLISQINVMAFLLPFTETITYDADGDLLTDGQWNYTWDAEHRLIEMVTNTASQGAGLAKTQVNFGYDYLGRRYSKTVTVNGGTPTTSQYVYFGWNVAAELDGSGNIKRHFIWGLDRSGTTSGLGGIGGLLMIQDTGQTYFPAYDGGGNVAALLDATNSGALAATYEYSPFGELQRKQGSYAISNPFRFSTKWWDEETGLSYYGMRYYNSALGRFISRDPIEEKGGINLYAFCGNSPVNGFDVLGQDDPILDPLAEYNDGGWAQSPISAMYNGGGSGDWVSNWFNSLFFSAPTLESASNSAPSTGDDQASVVMTLQAGYNPPSITIPTIDPTTDDETIDLTGVTIPSIGPMESMPGDAGVNASAPTLSLDPTCATNTTSPDGADVAYNNWLQETGQGSSAPNSGYYSIGYGASATVFDGKGYSVSVGASLVQPVSDPSLGSYLTLTFSLSSLTSGTGIAAFWGTGPSGGLQGSAPETGVGAPASHTEGGLVWGGGASYSTDSDANSTQVSPPTFPSLQGGHEGELGDGVAAYHASGTSTAYTIAIPIPQGPAPVIGPLPGLYYNPAYGPPGF